MALVYGGASLPCLSYKNYTHLCFSSGLLASQCRVYPLGGERALPFYSVRTDRAASATVATRHSLSTFGYTGARAAHVGTVHWAGKGETRAWMERGANREVMGVEEWMLAEPESRAAHREGRRSRILIDEDEYEWAQGPEKGSFVVRMNHSLLPVCIPTSMLL